MPFLLIQNGQEAGASPPAAAPSPPSADPPVIAGPRHAHHARAGSAHRSVPSRTGRTARAGRTARTGRPAASRSDSTGRTVDTVAPAWLVGVVGSGSFPTGPRSGHPSPPGLARAPTGSDGLSTAPVAVLADRQRRVTTPAPPPAPTTTTTALVGQPPSGVVEEGQVTYYDHPAGYCASPWLPFGTVVTVTNPANGESVSCVVNDREADTARAIDLATGTFAEIAPLSQGVIDAQLTW